MESAASLRAYLVDDEVLAINRLAKLLKETPFINIVGSTTDPETALAFLQRENVDLLFLDIQMPGMNGFELLAKLSSQPLVIFTTAYDKYALKAFDVNSLDYLLKPIDPRHLQRALNKFSQFSTKAELWDLKSQFQKRFSELAEKYLPPPPSALNRIGYRSGDGLVFIDLDKITHFYAEEKVTFAATSEGKKHIVDFTITELEQKLAANSFVRIHRSTLVNLAFVHELHRWFGGRMRVHLNDKNRTELTVARKQVNQVKERLGL